MMSKTNSDYIQLHEMQGEVSAETAGHQDDQNIISIRTQEREKPVGNGHQL